MFAGPPATFETQLGMSDLLPRWVLSSDDGKQVTLVSSRRSTEGPGGSDFPTAIRHTTFQPWDVFPSGEVIGPGFVAQEDGGKTVAAARSAGGQFALLFDAASAPTEGLLFADGFVPFQSGSPPQSFFAGASSSAEFVTQGASGHLFGISSPSSGGDPHYRFKIGFAGKDGTFMGPSDVGCADGTMFGDAVFAGGWWLGAYSSGSPPGSSECAPDGAWPSDVVLLRSNGVDAPAWGSLGAPGGATDVRMAARSDGAWVVIGLPPGQVVNGMFLGARVDMNLKVLATFPVGGSANVENPQNGSLAVAGVGDWLVAAWSEYGGDKGPFLSIKAFEPQAGAVVANLQIFPKGSFAGGPALLGSPVSNSFLVAWPEWDIPGGDSAIQAVRVDCLQAN